MIISTVICEHKKYINMFDLRVLIFVILTSEKVLKAIRLVRYVVVFFATSKLKLINNKLTSSLLQFIKFICFIRK